MDEPDRPLPAGWLVALATALVYASVGWVFLLLAGPPGYASPLYPPAGIALAATLVYGRAALPGVLLGSFSVNLLLGAMREPGAAPSLLLPLVIAAGAALQAGLGTWLVRRVVAQPLALTVPRDVLWTALLGAPVACVASASVATLALVVNGTLAPEAALSNWGTWWIGDALGVLIATPLVLTLIGRPAADWRPRRFTVGLPLLAASGLLAVALLGLHRWEAERMQAQFDRDTERLEQALKARLRGPVDALQALHSAALARGGTLDAASLRDAARWWLAQPPPLQAMGYSAAVPRGEVADFEQRAQAQGATAYRVFDREGAALAAEDAFVLALREIEPRARNASALGLNVLSVAAAREAVLAARDRGEPVATEGFRLTQSSGDETGTVLYQALYRPMRSELGLLAGLDAGTGEPPADLESRRARFAGVVFVTLRTEAQLEGLGGGRKGYLRWCLRDPALGAARPLWGGLPGCDGEAAAAEPWLKATRSMDFAGRTLTLQLAAPVRDVPGQEARSAWLLSMTGLAATALLGALLLVVTGHARRTERAVDAGTAVLRREMAERAATQQALADSEARLRAIVDRAPLGVAFLDARGRYLRVNDALSAMLGVPAAALLQERVLDRVHPGDRDSVIRGHLAMLRGRDDVATQQLRLRRADGGVLAVSATASVLRDADGRVSAMVGVFEDVTERRRLETSERALQQAEAASRAKSEFVSRMSHELRTPLNAMLGFAQLLGLDRSPALTAQQQAWAQQIQRAGWHLLEMINETLDLARIESGAVPLQTAAVPLPALIAACRELVAGPAAQRRITLAEHLSPEAGAVTGDPTRVKQIVTNLLSNAVKYNRTGGHVEVHTRVADDGVVELAVHDTGPGLTPSQLAELFQPYNRLGREDGEIQGTGIGLVISRRLAELMDGTLEASSVPGHGTTFTLRLPAATAAALVPDAVPLESPAAYRRRRVHYVEDNAVNVEVMRGILAQRPQIELTVSTMGLDGLGSLRQQRPDLILLDMQLPDISGLELLRHIKRDDTIADIPVIVVSADASPARTNEALTLGAVHYATKPVDVARFLAVLDELLEQIPTRFG